MSQKTQMQPKTTLLPFSVDRSFRLDDMFNTKCSMFNNRPFGDKPSRDLLFIKLWAIAWQLPEMGKVCREYQNGQI